MPEFRFCLFSHSQAEDVSGVIRKRIALILLLTEEDASLGLIAHFQRLYTANIITSGEHKALSITYILWTTKVNGPLRTS